MANLNMRCKSAMFALIMAASAFLSVSTASAIAVPRVKLGSVKRIAAVTSVVTFFAMWVRLITKGSNFDYKAKDYREDFELFLNSLNIFDAKSRATLLKLFDKWIIGRQLSIIDVTYKNKNEDGTEVSLKDKKLKTKPFGVLGWFDALVLHNLKKINELIKEAQGVSIMLHSEDPIGFILPEQSK